MLASYMIVNLIAKACKPHTIGESLIMPAGAVMLSTVMNQSPQEVNSVIPVGNSSVSRHIDEMAADVEGQLHLVAKNLAGRLHEALGHVIKAVNLMKNNAKKDCLFQQLCEKNNEEFEQLVLHTEVRWLSKGNCLNRLIALWDSVISFFSGTELGQKLVDAKERYLIPL
ncbi:zinc finger MYM-type protein 6-like [Palaemon carinicauda]|uniref:zinc finger MYM-type protein 6-like n=1 Tax=Palaemon carinicauda TaxID=392227 RepID=UPI0035B5A80E